MRFLWSFYRTIRDTPEDSAGWGSAAYAVFPTTPTGRGFERRPEGTTFYPRFGKECGNPKSLSKKSNRTTGRGVEHLKERATKAGLSKIHMAFQATQEDENAVTRNKHIMSFSYQIPMPLWGTHKHVNVSDTNEFNHAIFIAKST